MPRSRCPDRDAQIDLGPLSGTWIKMLGLLLTILIWIGIVNFLKLNYTEVNPPFKGDNTSVSFITRSIDRLVHYFLIDNNDSINVLIIAIILFGCCITIIILLLSFAYNQLNSYLAKEEMNLDVSKGISNIITANFLTPIQLVKGMNMKNRFGLHQWGRLQRGLGYL